MLVGYQTIVTVGLKICSRFPVNGQDLIAMDLPSRHHGLKTESPFKPRPVFPDCIPIVADSVTDIQGGKRPGTHAAVAIRKTMAKARQIKGIKLQQAKFPCTVLRQASFPATYSARQDANPTGSETN